jgi:hypothetical protein
VKCSGSESRSDDKLISRKRRKGEEGDEREWRWEEKEGDEKKGRERKRKGERDYLHWQRLHRLSVSHLMGEKRRKGGGTERDREAGLCMCVCLCVRFEKGEKVCGRDEGGTIRGTMRGTMRGRGVVGGAGRLTA